MPFTLSHAAAVLPFRRTHLEFSALVAGCFAPDFAYFINLRPHGFIGHRLSGVFIFDLPASLLALWLFYEFMRQPLLVFVPDGVRRRVEASAADFSFSPPRRLALIVLSILIGTATHILWDSFTHTFYWPYRHWSLLRLMVQLPFGKSVGVYKLLQHGSSLLGLVILAIWFWRWYRATKPIAPPATEPFTPRQRLTVMVVVPMLAICVAIVRAFLGVGVPASRWSAMYFAAEVGISTVTFFALGIVACGVAFRGRAGARERIETKV